jgi:hypothetical protein
MTSRTFGPASYFPSIEAKYGRSIAAWNEILQASGLGTYKELMALLKGEYGVGHGHANALVLSYLEAVTPQRSRAERVDALFPPKKAHWRPAYDELLSAARGFGPVQVLPKNTSVALATRVQFALLSPATPTRFDVDLRRPGMAASGRLEPLADNGSMTHRVHLTDPRQVDSELLGWLQQAYDASR